MNKAYGKGKSFNRTEQVLCRTQTWPLGKWKFRFRSSQDEPSTWVNQAVLERSIYWSYTSIMEEKNHLVLLSRVNAEGTPTIGAPWWDGQRNSLFVKQGFTHWVFWCCQVELVDLCLKAQSHPPPNDKFKPFWNSSSSNIQNETPDGAVSISGHWSSNVSPAWTPIISDDVSKMHVF